ncbi:beta-ketoacyl synthase N-terminal-like domain-containing protein [Tamlana sp. 2_MG-2023]|uniref:beta-ketoacyl synthase N-terminal-like domain-containing protein n=1 Tax=unclassified Tamlana TaxID=2614803 RepID=UPI0026E41AC5|nr:MULTISPECIES: beta-ketoacyl synthase N-terminal-like domain-containing protein [unclassified Tamlana]MDO6761083.1 beta-ketoacyl synthase N-terminal-like domain-containing protein [Tamlana sp. 2_MG-2023]MDO6791584.1 beta-ketoacyl synthase N-terminal-like domain-containing protein [Tamlana sp. 1_MG-2023]
MQQPISITAISSISSLGKTPDDIWQSYLNNTHCFTAKTVLDKVITVAEIPEQAKQDIEILKASDQKYKSLDNSVLYAIYASRLAVKQANWKASDNFGINLGSSRGATELFETYYDSFLKTNKAETLSSPTTTLGNIASWVAHDLQTEGPEISHSITCSTALHAMLNGIAWINSGMCNKFLVGGSEAPLTPFTIAQMQALKIYAQQEPGQTDYPCRAFDLDKTKNTMVLGEGASVACLESGIQDNALAIISGYGYATEILKHNISISSDAQCFQKSMKMALGDLNPDDVDVIVMHAPGTIKGDLSEVKAIEKVFTNKQPALTTNKWKIGHTFGASGALSVELAVLMLQKQEFIAVPFAKTQTPPKKIQHILVNAVGFGGNAVSILISKS